MKLRPRIGISLNGRNEIVRKKNQKSKALAKIEPVPKPVPCELVEIGQVLLCKMRGYVAWPALVNGIENKLISIEFFGDKTTHKATIGNFFKFEASQAYIIGNLKRKKNFLYSKAVKEAEIMLGVPSKNSILNQIA